MIDTKGNLNTMETKFKEHTLNHYKSVLSNKQINNNPIHLKDKKGRTIQKNS